LVLNNAKVTPSRLYSSEGAGRGEERGAGRGDGRGKGKGEGRVEVLILNPPVNSMRAGVYELWCLAYPGRKLKVGKEISFEKDGCVLHAKVVEISPSGQRLLKFDFSERPAKILDKLGHLPLPPYIRRPDRREDFERYQTVYATEAGAVAAPTAGLHFTENHLKALKAKGFNLAYVHLRVGAGTFLPLTKENLDRGVLHEEFAEIEEDTAKEILSAKKEGRTIVSVGTTSVRALEWAALGGGSLKPKRGYTDIFIRPGFDFKVTDAMITNFHLPGSSLLMLVSAFAGLQNIKKAYELAVKERFRFFSYGDAMVIL
jgi:S-adenosylmethionine:tRNA ribosyltransferase-isomerase